MPNQHDVTEALERLVKRVFPRADYHLNKDKPTQIGPDGEIVLRTGTPGEPIEECLSPFRRCFEHHFPTAIAEPSNRVDGESRAQLKLKLRTLSDAIRADRSLGGLVDWLDATAAELDPIEVPGARSGIWADLDIVATYWSDDPIT